MKIKSFEFNPFGELTYLVWDETTGIAAVVDPGMTTKDEQDTFDDFVTENRLQLKYLLYTHLHIDHTFGHEYVREKYGLQAMANEADAPLGKYRAQQAEMFRLRMAVPEAITIDIPLRDQMLLEVGNQRLKVIAVPGHSQGSVAFYCQESKFVITGDALFRGSIGRTDLPGGAHKQLIESIRQRLLTLPDDTVVYPGHGPSTTIKAEKRNNPFII